MKGVLFIFILLFLGVGFVKASSFRIDEDALEQKFNSATEIEAKNIQSFFNISSNFTKSDERVIAGLLGIVCGGIGLHRFYLGQTKTGFIYLGTLCGIVTLYSFITALTGGIGAILWPFTLIPHVVGIVDGIFYLLATDEDFETKYKTNVKLFLWQ